MANNRNARRTLLSAIAFLSLFSTINAQFNDGSTAVRGPCSLANVDGDCGEQGKQYGDVVIGGLFPVHKAERDEQGMVKCKDTVRTMNEYGFERLEAMRYAVLKANQNRILGDIKIGYEMRDTCQDSRYALRQSISFLNIASSSQRNYRFTVGVVGASSSGISSDVTDFLNLFGVPLVSYASTSAKLSDFNRYPSFFRTLPPDRFQARAMVDIVRKLGWRYVYTVSSSGTYGYEGIRSFMEAARAAKIDIGKHLELPRGTGDVRRAREVVQMAVRRSLSNLPSTDPLRRGNLMVIFAQLDVAKNVMAAIASTAELKNRKFTFVVSDSAGDKVEVVYDPHENISNLAVAQGMLSVIPELANVEELEGHTRSLNPHNYTPAENTWFAQYWEKRFGCNPLVGTTSSVAECRRNNLLAKGTLDSKVGYVIDAVNVFVYALRDLLKDKCEGRVEMCDNASLCFKEAKFCSSEFRRYIKNVHFDAQSGVEFRFENGDFVQAKYDIKNLHVNEEGEPPENIEFVSVGTWQLGDPGQDPLQLNGENLVWITGDTGVQNAPVANCSDECTLGEYKERIKIGKSRDYAYTCWKCRNCGKRHHYISYKTDQYGECKRCPSDSTSNSLHTGCIKLEVEYLKYGNHFANFLVFLAVVGIALITTTLVVLFARWDTPVVKASSRELSILLLSGLLLCFLLAFAFIGEPTDVTCGIRRVGPGIFVSMVFGSLLIKTNRISRLFNRKVTMERPVFISPLSQLVFTAIIVLVSCVIAAVRLLLSPPETETQIEPNVRVTRMCLNLVDWGLLVSWLWTLALIVACTYYGFITRKIPENFRETLFINFAIYSEFILWLAFIPFGFVDLDHQNITALTSLATMLSAFPIWGFLFVPKLYIVVLRPERNKRQTTHQTSRPSPSNTHDTDRSATTAMQEGNSRV
ncbi:metabotropic glutamate receptor 8-like [Corticium candelabrum]|uniref:metabotropic glutamate receptor 8-like n=1 Tax=Corticium candelabrum TaxID=121492 RepID=UPI002E262A74|nr:metabotropic glutamate receptor 8-like [Corticium candelabrum]